MTIRLPLMIVSMIVCPTHAMAPASTTTLNDNNAILFSQQPSQVMSEDIMTPAPQPEPTKLEGRQSEIVVKLARKWSKIFHVPRSWIRSQAWVETQDHLDAVNPVTGAMGIMQIMPRTYEWLLPSLKRTKLARNHNVRTTLHASATGKRDDLLDGDLNVMMAAYFLAILKRKFGGDHRIVAAAYEAGHVRIARCLDEGTIFPAQAQEYVTRVEAAKRHGFM